ncbi:outer membrane usher protein FimD [Escherichia coli]|uniref:Outer membrane usher protein FimD n=1 Tax=Escherichia coli TaxID=562 RepID=A0A376U1V2_ECOLX|nr:outer membrane usher protein FimD [Escherichia coli]
MTVSMTDNRCVFSINKSLNESGTNIQLVGYRYSTSGYFNFADTTYSRMNGYNIETQDGVIQVKPKFTDYYISLITNAGNYNSPLLSNSGAH